MSGGKASQRLLARCSQVRVPGGGPTIETPILIPSFSSKGLVVDKDGVSEVGSVLEFVSEWLTDSMLVSAYDIYYGHLPNPDALNGTPEITVVDSGGYEARVEHDLSTSVHNPYAPNDWTEPMLIKVLDEWPTRYPAIFVSYDHPTHRQTLTGQIEAARALFGKYPNQLHTLLLKPGTVGQTYLSTTMKEAVASAECLAEFDMIGVTEKELGRSISDRMLEIARLRLAMDDADIKAPIHVFGALDPLTSCLYFLAGAEVFDGLTWLRYAYQDGQCVYQLNSGALRMGCDFDDKHVRRKVLSNNVHYLKRLRTEMRRFTLDGDFSHFEHHQDFLRNEYDSLRTKLKGRI